MSRLVVANGTVLAMDPSIGDAAGLDVLIEDGCIAAVGRGLPRDGAEVIDAGGGLVMPGLVNAHLHTWQTPLRGIGGDWVGADYDDILHARLAPLYRPEDLYVATLFGALSQLDAGTTTIFDWCHNNPTPAHSDAAIDALEASGIRAVFGHGSAKPKPEPGAPHFSTVPHDRAEIARLRRGRLSSDTARVTLAACLLGPDYSNLDVCRQDFALVREFELLSSAHVWGQSNRVVPDGYGRLATEGLLGPAHNIVHGNYLDDAELGLILDSGVSVTSTPSVELRNHVREPLSVRVRRMGARPSFGVDCEAFACDRMIDALRYALQVHRLFNNVALVTQLEAEAARTRGRVDAGGSVVKAVSVRTREVLEWGTMDNARALRLDQRIGSLTPGKQADLIVVRLNGMAIAPAPDPAQALIQFAQNADIDTVLVGGKAVKRHGRLTVEGVEGARRGVEALARTLFDALPEDLRRRCALGPG